MDTFNYVLTKYGLTNNRRGHIEIPDTGRTDLAKLFCDLNFKLGAEIGVAAGEYSLEICENNPQLVKMWGIDPWTPYKEYHDYTREKTFLSLQEGAINKLSSYPFYEFIREFSMDAIKRFDDNSLDFVYIDANHQDPYVSEDVYEWAKKVRPGGIISGHDWQQPRGQDYKVKEAVIRYATENKLTPFFVFGLKDRLEGMVRDNSRSWMIVKQ
jgi:hypothetical protein